MVTVRSCIASSSADCVLAGARLISSASRNVGEQRAAHQRELVARQVEHIGAGDVGRHQVRRELDALELARPARAQRTHQQRLAEAGHAFDQRVLVAEHRHQRVAQRVLLPDDHLAKFARDVVDHGLKLVEGQSSPFDCKTPPMRRSVSAGLAGSRKICSACRMRCGVTERRFVSSHARQHAAASSFAGM